MDTIEENFYEIATDEIAQKKPIKSIYGKAFSDALGDKEKTMALYIKYRVKQLKDIYTEEKIKRDREAFEEKRKRDREMFSIFTFFRQGKNKFIKVFSFIPNILNRVINQWSKK